MERLFTGTRGFVCALIAAFGEDATIARGGAPRVEERARFAWDRRATSAEESRVAGGLATRRDPTMLRTTADRLAGILSPDGLATAPRAGRDRLVVAGRSFRIESVEEYRVGGRVAAYRVVCARS